MIRASRKPTKAKPAAAPQVGMTLHTSDGARKYLTAGERDAFLRAAEQSDRQARTLCMTLAYAGCRLSEALALTVDRVDIGAGVLVFETLKNAGTASIVRYRCPLLCSKPSISCMAFAKRKRAVIKGGASACGLARA